MTSVSMRWLYAAPWQDKLAATNLLYGEISSPLQTTINPDSSF